MTQDSARMVCRVVLCAGAIALGTIVRTEEQQTAPRPTLLLIHGLDSQGRVSDNVERPWQDAIDLGLGDAGFTGLIPRESRTFFWYGRLANGQQLSAVACGTSSRPSAPPREPHRSGHGCATFFGSWPESYRRTPSGR